MPPVPMSAILNKFNNPRTRAVSLVDAFVEVLNHSISWAGVAVIAFDAALVAVMRLLRHLIQVFTWRCHVELIMMEFSIEELRQLTDT
jgi:hypothetical protein